jgi:hypothetical protein
MTNSILLESSIMRDLRSLIGATAILLAIGAAGARSADMAQLKPAICGARASCAIAKLTPAGKSEAGAALAVAEVHFGVADAPDPQFPCHDADGNNDGGQEYWLVEGALAPRLLLKLCNDGYGAAGVGMDEITIADNRFTHFQAGGSNDRWEATDAIRLAPQTLLRVDSCEYRGTDPDLVDFTTADLGSMEINSLAIGDAAKAGTADEGGCDVLKKDIALPPKPGFVGGLNVPMPNLGQDPTNPVVFPEGTVLGGCAGRLNASAASPALVYGKADPGREAELRFLALGPQSLVVQIWDSRPDKAKPASWIGADHLELWTLTEPGDSYLPDPAKAAQLGIGLDGTTYGGTGKAPVPKIQRWTAKDDQGRPVTVMKLDWSEEFALASGVIIAYSQGEGGRQARLWATGPIRKNKPGYLPALFALPVACGAVDGQWAVTKNPGKLNAPADAPE